MKWGIQCGIVLVLSPQISTRPLNLRNGNVYIVLPKNELAFITFICFMVMKQIYSYLSVT